ncbi:MAG: hypothetical protein XD63_1307 [Thermoanaerobacterales bacterium 50_218]|nr:MAG: hypothetical protein XD63_1307 [Thermoanaerobacterales bacterium 50_218]
MVSTGEVGTKVASRGPTSPEDGGKQNKRQRRTRSGCLNLAATSSLYFPAVGDRASPKQDTSVPVPPGADGKPERLA